MDVDKIVWVMRKEIMEFGIHIQNIQKCNVKYSIGNFVQRRMGVGDRLQKWRSEGLGRWLRG